MAAVSHTKARPVIILERRRTSKGSAGAATPGARENGRTRLAWPRGQPGALSSNWFHHQAGEADSWITARIFSAMINLGAAVLALK